MMMITFVFRVLCGWFAFGITLGLCWMVACFTTRFARDAIAAMAKLELFDRLCSVLLLPARGRHDAERGVGLGLAMPSSTAPVRATLTGALVRSHA